MALFAVAVLVFMLLGVFQKAVESKRKSNPFFKKRNGRGWRSFPQKRKKQPNQKYPREKKTRADILRGSQNDFPQRP
jgi:hypothetical protein